MELGPIPQMARAPPPQQQQPPPPLPVPPHDASMHPSTIAPVSSMPVESAAPLPDEVSSAAGAPIRQGNFKNQDTVARGKQGRKDVASARRQSKQKKQRDQHRGAELVETTEHSGRDLTQQHQQLDAPQLSSLQSAAAVPASAAAVHDTVESRGDLMREAWNYGRGRGDDDMNQAAEDDDDMNQAAEEADDLTEYVRKYM